MKCGSQYKRFTIKSLFNSLEEIMARNPNITMDSEVIISDLNMSYFKQEIKVYPTYDYKDGQMKIGLYLNPYENGELLDTTTEETVQVKEETVQADCTSKDLSWLNKYARR